ncbi:hypothetical protein [Streptomyces adustus]
MFEHAAVQVQLRRDGQAVDPYVLEPHPLCPEAAHPATPGSDVPDNQAEVRVVELGEHRIPELAPVELGRAEHPIAADDLHAGDHLPLQQYADVPS